MCPLCHPPRSKQSEGISVKHCSPLQHGQPSPAASFECGICPALTALHSEGHPWTVMKTPKFHNFGSSQGRNFLILKECWSLIETAQSSSIHLPQFSRLQHPKLRSCHPSGINFPSTYITQTPLIAVPGSYFNFSEILWRETVQGVTQILRNHKSCVTHNLIFIFAWWSVLWGFKIDLGLLESLISNSFLGWRKIIKSKVKNRLLIKPWLSSCHRWAQKEAPTSGHFPTNTFCWSFSPEQGDGRTHAPARICLDDTDKII